ETSHPEGEAEEQAAHQPDPPGQEFLAERPPMTGATRRSPWRRDPAARLPVALGMPFPLMGLHIDSQPPPSSRKAGRHAGGRLAAEAAVA
ncbi:hypothetical protein CS379_09390, partial [Methylobacterium frigidaeris]|uniref:hypothetical protein n=1 Tax=Methylobacterium frigidaeris TaxID=2038277 RepID=UPI000C4274B3